jgi:hypothetical protein
MGVVKFMDIKISASSGYHKGFVGLLIRLLVMESNRKAAF